MVHITNYWIILYLFAKFHSLRRINKIVSLLSKDHRAQHSVPSMCVRYYNVKLMLTCNSWKFLEISNKSIKKPNSWRRSRIFPRKKCDVTKMWRHFLNNQICAIRSLFLRRLTYILSFNLHLTKDLPRETFWKDNFIFEPSDHSLIC